MIEVGLDLETLMAAHPHAYRTVAFRLILLQHELNAQTALVRLLARLLVRIEDAGLARRAKFFTSDEYHIHARIETAMTRVLALRREVKAMKTRLPTEQAERAKYARQRPRPKERLKRPSPVVRKLIAEYRKERENAYSSAK